MPNAEAATAASQEKEYYVSDFPLTWISQVLIHYTVFDFSFYSDVGSAENTVSQLYSVHRARAARFNHRIPFCSHAMIFVERLSVPLEEPSLSPENRSIQSHYEQRIPLYNLLGISLP